MEWIGRWDTACLTDDSLAMRDSEICGDFGLGFASTVVVTLPPGLSRGRVLVSWMLSSEVSLNSSRSLEISMPIRQ